MKENAPPEIVANFKCLADSSQTAKSRLHASSILADASSSDWMKIPEADRDPLAVGLLKVIEEQDEDETLRANAAKALQPILKELPMETNEQAFGVLAKAIQEGVDGKRLSLLAEACKLVSESRVMKCENKALLKELNDAIFNAVLLGKSTDDTVFTQYADDAFGRSRNRMNQLEGDWD